MNGIITKTRLLGLAGVVALATAMALPSPAQAGKAHLLKLYKVEDHLDVDGQDGEYVVTCPGNDLALDGMWRVDDVAQDNDYVYDGPGGSWSLLDPPEHSDWDLLRSLRPVTAERNSDSSYRFRFTPLSGGDVSMKLWVTCLGNPSEAIGSHTVSWQITSGGSAAITTNALTPGASCATGFVAVQPSFDVTGGDADLVASYPSNSARQWNWMFDNLQGAFSATVSWKCLELRSQPAVPATGPPNHRHRIVRKMANKFTPAGAILPTSVGEKQAICGEHYKGMMGGWDISNSVDEPSRFGQMHFLGMDPRIKHRAFKFINRDSVFHSPDLYLVCFKDKTT